MSNSEQSREEADAQALQEVDRVKAAYNVFHNDEPYAYCNSQAEFEALVDQLKQHDGDPPVLVYKPASGIGLRQVLKDKPKRQEALDTLSIKAAQAGLGSALIRLRRSATVSALLEMWLATGATDDVIRGFDDTKGSAKEILDSEIKPSVTIRSLLYAMLRSVE